MPKFLTVRTIPPLAQEQITDRARRALSLGQAIGVKWVKSYYSAIDGKLYCEWEAPSIEAIYEHARLLESPIDYVSLISAEFDPSMFK
ncbi:MAG TPA: nickel-binding protein [Thermodesulfobacteriota bacterium]|nr:nickel-binding protein [Thermodesulfobacteriota bacterium]